MEKRYDKGQIETVVLQAVLARPYKEFGGCRIYPLHAEGEDGWNPPGLPARRRQKSCGQP